MVDKLPDITELKKLREPFDRKYVRKKGRYNFISHGIITERLIEVDPLYETRVDHVHTYTDAQGALHCAGVTMTLTMHLSRPHNDSIITYPVSRTESGGPQREESFANEIKNAQSDALKRCAMRFGIALDMWESLVDAEHDEDYQVPQITPGEWKELVALMQRAYTKEEAASFMMEMAGTTDWKQMSARQAADMRQSLNETKPRQMSEGEWKRRLGSVVGNGVVTP